eukprot:gene11990-biopygen18443
MRVPFTAATFARTTDVASGFVGDLVWPCFQTKTCGWDGLSRVPNSGHPRQGIRRARAVAAAAHAAAAWLGLQNGGAHVVVFPASHHTPVNLHVPSLMCRVKNAGTAAQSIHSKLVNPTRTGFGIRFQNSNSTPPCIFSISLELLCFWRYFRRLRRRLWRIRRRRGACGTHTVAPAAPLCKFRRHTDL